MRRPLLCRILHGMKLRIINIIYRKYKIINYVYNDVVLGIILASENDYNR